MSWSRAYRSKVSLIYASVLGIAGMLLLYVAANALAMMLAVIGFVIYVGVYSLYMKRKSVYGTLIGSLSGAAPRYWLLCRNGAIRHWRTDLVADLQSVANASFLCHRHLPL